MEAGETIALIKALGNGGGSSLPPVTSSDNGKVLAVQDGAWVAGKSVYIINTENDVADIGVNEIMALMTKGILPILHHVNLYYIYANTSGSSYFVNISYNGTTGNYTAKYATVGANKTVNTGPTKALYQKPSTGIPETDLAQAVKDKLNKFVVTLTPTAADLSGTMDKTPEEITAAYSAGQEIVFSIPSMDALLTPVQFLDTGYTIVASAHIIYNLGNGDVMIAVTTDSSASIYYTTFYSLTPAS